MRAPAEKRWHLLEALRWRVHQREYHRHRNSRRADHQTKDIRRCARFSFWRPFKLSVTPRTASPGLLSRTICRARRVAALRGLPFPESKTAGASFVTVLRWRGARRRGRCPYRQSDRLRRGTSRSSLMMTAQPPPTLGAAQRHRAWLCRSLR